MQQKGYKQILAVCYVIIFCCCFITSTHAWRLEGAQESRFMQKNNPDLPEMSRVEELKLLSSLLHLEQKQSQLDDGLDADTPLDNAPYLPLTQILSRGSQEQSGRGLTAVKRQRPCFWSVITCY